MAPRVNQPRCPSRSQWPPCSLFWPCKVTKMTRRGWGNIEDLRNCLLSVFTGWELCSAPPCGDVSHRPHVLILEGLSQGRHLYGFTFSIISSFCFIVVFSTTTIGMNQFDFKKKNSFYDHMMKPKYSQNHLMWPATPFFCWQTATGLPWSHTTQDKAASQTSSSFKMVLKRDQ